MYETVRELLRLINFLNVYQIKIAQKLHQVYFYHFYISINNICIQLDFLTLITLSQLNKCKFRISIRGPYLWNEFLAQTGKEIESTSSFKILVTQKLISSYNELSHF